MICARCQTLYCSRKCQESDWPIHKTACNVMPMLVDMNSRNANILDLSDSSQNQNKSPNTTSPQSHVGKNTNNSKPNNVPIVNGNSGQNCNKSNNYRNNKDNNKHNNHQNNDNSHQNKGQNQQKDYKSQQQTSPQHQIKPQNNKNSTQQIRSTQNGDASAVEISKAYKSPLEPTKSEILKPQIVNLQTANNSPNITTLIPFPKSGSIVKITCIMTTDVVYIRPVANGAHKEYAEIIQAVQRYASKSKPLTKLPKRGDLVLAEFQNSGYYRALVVKELENEVIVAYIDFGNTDMKKMSELMELTPQLASLPRHALRTKLAGIENNVGPKSLEAIDYLQLLCDDQDDLTIKYNGEYNTNDPIELYDNRRQQSVNKTVLNILKIAEPTLSDRVITMTDIPKRFLPVGKNIEAIVLDNSMLESAYVSCIDPSVYNDRLAITQAIDDYCQNIPNEPYTPRLYEACLVKYKNSWYRGACVEKCGTGQITVMFLDHGMFQLIPIDSIRRFPEAFSKEKCCAVFCCINNVPPELSEADLAKMREIFALGKTIIIDSVGTVDYENDENEKEESSVLTVHRLDKYFRSKASSN